MDDPSATDGRSGADDRTRTDGRSGTGDTSRTDGRGSMDDRGADDPFEEWVAEAIDALPPVFRERLGSVAITIEDAPSPALLASLGVPGLYGLYQGVPRSRLGADHAATPSRITIYREPIRRSFPTEAGQRAKVFDTVQHEIAHHFGISDERLHELKASGHRPPGST